MISPDHTSLTKVTNTYTFLCKTYTSIHLLEIQFEETWMLKILRCMHSPSHCPSLILHLPCFHNRHAPSGNHCCRTSKQIPSFFIPFSDTIPHYFSAVNKNQGWETIVCFQRGVLTKLSFWGLRRKMV